LAGAKGPVYVLADDSGLEVDALDGAPGVHSARFAAVDAGRETAGNSSDAENNAKLLRLLQDVPKARRTARFRCVIALTPLIENPGSDEPPVHAADELARRTWLFEGACEGTIGHAAKGGSGFGYDPLFTPIGERQTFAELGEELKNRISHRAGALRAMQKCLIAEGPCL
jgi:XTP/dITP diphosphohydrolase